MAVCKCQDWSATHAIYYYSACVSGVTLRLMQIAKLVKYLVGSVMGYQNRVVLGHFMTFCVFQ